MKNLIKVTGLIALTMVSCGKNISDKITKIERYKKYITNPTVKARGVQKNTKIVVFDQFRVEADRERMPVIKSIINILEKTNGKVFKFNPQTTNKTLKVPYNGNMVDGFYVNGVGIMYSDSILSVAQKVLGPNSNVPFASAMKEVLCPKQYELFMGEYDKLHPPYRKTIERKDKNSSFWNNEEAEIEGPQSVTDEETSDSCCDDPNTSLLHELPSIINEMGNGKSENGSAELELTNGDLKLKIKLR